MTKEEREQAIIVLTHEELCVYRNVDNACDRDCEKCDLVLNDVVLIKAYDLAIEALKQEPTGHWIIDIDESRRWDRKRFYCSECGEWQTYGETKFCPNCGMPMGKENR